MKHAPLDTPFVLRNPIDNSIVKELSDSLKIPRILTEILLHKGYLNPTSAHEYLYPKLSYLRQPEGNAPMSGFCQAADRICQAIIAQEQIGIFGDYDVDGITTAALLTDFLKKLGAKVYTKLATRTSGYGFSLAAAKEFISQHCSLIITGDCGTSDIEALSYCKDNSVDTIVVDHHQVPTIKPPVLSLLNPHQSDCLFPFKGMASVGIAFYLASAIKTRFKKLSPLATPLMVDFLDLVALGTVADLAPLEQENRILVRAGLAELRKTKRPGLKALIKLSGIKEPDKIFSSDIAFRLAPRLNAPGRLHDPTLALELLLEQDEQNAQHLATRCQQANLDRQIIQEAVFKEADQQAEQQIFNEDPPVLVLANTNWHQGVLGIIAAKITELYKKPSVVLSIHGDYATGSMRTIRGFNCYTALQQASSILQRYGGHSSAAGLTIEVGLIDSLRQILCLSYQKQIPNGEPGQAIVIDSLARAEELNFELVEGLALLEPFGMGNPEPLLLLQNVRLLRYKIVGQGHVQMQLSIQDQIFDGIGFSMQETFKSLTLEQYFSMAVIPEIDTFKGYPKIKLRIRHIQPLL